MDFNFKKKCPDVKQRHNDSNYLLEKYKDKIPIICEKYPKAQLKELDNTKYLVQREATFSQFLYTIRKKIDLKKDTALYILAIVGTKAYALSGDISIGEIYEKYKDPDDGFLYLVYDAELFPG